MTKHWFVCFSPLISSPPFFLWRHADCSVSDFSNAVLMAGRLKTSLCSPWFMKTPETSYYRIETYKVGFTVVNVSFDTDRSASHFSATFEWLVDTFQFALLANGDWFRIPNAETPIPLHSVLNQHFPDLPALRPIYLIFSDALPYSQHPIFFSNKNNLKKIKIK